MLRKIALATLVGTLLLVSSLALPAPVAAQQTGPWVDEIIFSVIPQEQAVASVSAGDTDIYVFPLETPTDKVAARDDPNIDTYEAVTGMKDMWVNPVPFDPTATDKINPFVVREAREALNYAIDREHIIAEILGGFGLPYVAHHFRNQPDYARDAGFFAKLEAKYSYDPSKAKAQMESALATVPGVTIEDGNFMYGGEQIEVIIVQRTEDLRFEVANYIATEIEALGFDATLDPSPASEAFAKTYFGDPRAGLWHMYTEGWGFTGFIQYDDTNCGYFYNGDFGSAIWDYYTPPPALTIPADTLYFSEYIDLEERRDLLRKCSEEGLKDGIRIFLDADIDVVAVNSDTTHPVWDLFGGVLNWRGLKTIRIGGTTGGTLNAAQPIHTVSNWNAWGGFTWVYEEHQRRAFSDPGVATHPHLGTVIPFRLDFSVETVGPIGDEMAVPEDAVMYNVSSGEYEAVGPGVTSKSYVDFSVVDEGWGSWHHGVDIGMDDIMAGIAYTHRIVEGDLSLVGPTTAEQPGFVLFINAIRGIEFIDADSFRMWYDSWNPDPTVIAGDASPWPLYPWEVDLLMAKSVLDNDTSMNEVDAENLGNEFLDLVKGPSLALLAEDLWTLSQANVRPGATGFGGNITDVEATARWDALLDWYNGTFDMGHFYPSSGPFYIEQVTTDPEGTVLTAFRTGYPFDVDHWEDLTSIAMPEVSLGTPPTVIQTFPATFGLSTSLAGDPYDAIAVNSWLVIDPATKNVLFDGTAARVDVGEWEIVLSADQTTALTEGSWTLRTIVVGAAAAAPIISDLSFSVQSLRTALLTEMTNLLDTELGEFADEIQDITNRADDAVSAANSATSLVYIVLGVAVVGIVVAIVGIIVVLMRMPKRPT